MAETWVIEDETGTRYFCKVTDKPLFIPGIVAALPAVADMYAQGMERICYPIPGRNGFHQFIGPVLIVLYNYIDAPQSEDYDMFAFGKLTAQIHILKLNNKPPAETFEFSDRAIFDTQFEGTLSSYNPDPIVQSLKKLLQTHEQVIRGHLARFLSLTKACRNEPCAFVPTHCDAPGNVLVKAPDDLYIIDWDELELAPPEQDLWIVDHEPGFFEGYKTIRPDFVMNQNMRSYFILKYYFRRLMYYCADILDENAASEHRQGLLKALDQGQREGWMLPKLAETA